MHINIYNHQQHHHNNSTTSYSLIIQVKEKIQHIMIDIIFDTYQSFTYHHIVIPNYPQKICQVFGLKDYFWQVRIILPFFKSYIKTKQICLRTSTKYIHKSHVSAVVYTSAYHRPNHLNSKFGKVRLISLFFMKFKFSKQDQAKVHDFCPKQF